MKEEKKREEREGTRKDEEWESSFFTFLSMSSSSSFGEQLATATARCKGANQAVAVVELKRLSDIARQVALPDIWRSAHAGLSSTAVSVTHPLLQGERALFESLDPWLLVPEFKQTDSFYVVLDRTRGVVFYWGVEEVRKRKREKYNWLAAAMGKD